MRKEQPFYFFIHVSKNGGSTAENIFRKLVDIDARARRVAVRNGIRVNFSTLQPNRTRVGFASREEHYHVAHVSGWIAGQRNVRMLTLPREPVDHTISMYAMLIADPYVVGRRSCARFGYPRFNMPYSEWLKLWSDALKQLQSPATAQCCTIIEPLMKRGGNAWQPTNFQTQFYGSRSDMAGALEAAAARAGSTAEFKRSVVATLGSAEPHLRVHGGPAQWAYGGSCNETYKPAVDWCLWHERSGWLEREVFARARALVENAWVVGVTARMEDTWRVLIDKMGLPAALQEEAVKAYTSVPARTHGTRSERRLIGVDGIKLARKLNAQDSVLHSYALARLSRDVLALDDALAAAEARRADGNERGPGLSLRGGAVPHNNMWRR